MPRRFFPFSRHWPPPRSDRGKLVDRKAPFWSGRSAFLSPFSAGTLDDDILLPKTTLTKSTEWLGALVGGAAIAARDDDDGDDGDDVRRAERMGSAEPRLRGAAARREAEAGRAPIAEEARRAKAMALRGCAGRRRRRGRGKKGRRGSAKVKGVSVVVVVSFDLCSSQSLALTFLHKIGNNVLFPRVVVVLLRESPRRPPDLFFPLARLRRASLCSPRRLSLCQGSSREQPPFVFIVVDFFFTLATSPADGLVPPRPDGLQGAFLILSRARMTRCESDTRVYKGAARSKM